VNKYDIFEHYPLTVLFILICISISFGVIYGVSSIARYIINGILAINTAVILSVILKVFFREKRDYTHVVKIMEYRFPSLHSAVAFAGTLTVIHYIGINCYSIIITLIAIIASVSRLVFGYHKFDEVLVGVLIGIDSYLLSTIIVGGVYIDWI